MVDTVLISCFQRVGVVLWAALYGICERFHILCVEDYAWKILGAQNLKNKIKN